MPVPHESPDENGEAQRRRDRPLRVVPPEGEQPGGDAAGYELFDGFDGEPFPEPPPLPDEEGQYVKPLAPLDVRAREVVIRALKAIPSWNERPPSFVESIEYSQRGDWATSTNGFKRGIHTAATIVVFVLTFPLDLAMKLRPKPIAFVLTIVLLIIVSHIL